jgi:hypothetical protein
MITATYHRDQLPDLAVKCLRRPNFPALTKSLVCGTVPNGEMWLLDITRVRVQIHATKTEIPLQQFLDAGGTLDQIT